MATTSRAHEDHYSESAEATIKGSSGWLFDVTCVIGSVYQGDGIDNPVQAAMRMIADHDTEGVFRFPLQDGGEQIVTIERTERTNQLNANGE